MLVLTVRENEIVKIGDLEIFYRETRGNRVRMFFKGDPDIKVIRTKEMAEVPKENKDEQCNHV